MRHLFRRRSLSETACRGLLEAVESGYAAEDRRIESAYVSFLQDEGLDAECVEIALDVDSEQDGPRLTLRGMAIGAVAAGILIWLALSGLAPSTPATSSHDAPAPIESAEPQRLHAGVHI